jgi:hypothetical protein
VRNQLQQQQADDSAARPASALDEEVEDRGPVAERSSYLADRKVAQLKAEGADEGLEEESAVLDVEGLDEAVDAAQRGPETGDAGGASLGEGDAAAVEAPAPAAAQEDTKEKPREAPSAAAPAPVPEETRAGVEAQTGTDLSSVRVVAASPLADEMGALAFTMGDEIHVAPGAPAAGSPAGRRLLAHELTHVVQQREGRVDGEDGTVNDDPALEAEADAAEKAPAKSAASAATSAPIQRKTKVKKVKSSYPDAATLRGMKLGAFLEHCRNQLDWAIKITPADKKPLQELLTWTTKLPAIGGGCSEITVADLLATGNKPAIEAYAKAASSPSKAPTAKCEAVNNIAEAETFGDALIKMHGVLDGRNLYHISSEDTTAELIRGNHVDAFVLYVKTCHPALHAPNGRELRSFIDYVVEVKDPVKYTGSIPKVRNYHRFQEAALKKLAINYSDTSRARPLGLILHTALDWNGAFHRDPHLTELVTHPRNLMLMVEGYGSLADYQSQIGPLAKSYGRDGKIDQVMVAGHGSSQSMELAGEVAPGTEDNMPTMQQSKNDGLNLDPDPSNAAEKKKTEAFFDEIIANMEDEPSFWEDPNARRVVFNACLTGANDIEIEDEATAGPYKNQIDKSLKDKPSLSTSFGQRAKDQGKDIESVGANGSFGSIELMQSIFRVPFLVPEKDADGKPVLDDKGSPKYVWENRPVFNGKMDLGSEIDPALTSSKMEYLEKGHDPPGVMMALVEVWTKPGGATAPWQTAADTHKGAAGTDWQGTQILTFLELVRAKYNDDVKSIRSLVKIADDFEYLGDFPGLGFIAEHLAKHPDAAAILDGMKRCTEPDWYGRVTLAHAAAIIGRKNEFLDELTGFPNGANDLMNVVDPGLLAGKGVLAGLLTPTDTPHVGQVILASVDVLKNGGGSATSQAFLKKLLDGSGRFKPAAKIKDALGTVSEDELLEALGVKNAPIDPDAEVSGNVDLDRDKKNEQFLQPVNQHGTVTASSLNVRKRASKGSDSIGELKAGDTVFVVGKTGEWLAIDWQVGATKSRTAFVHQDYVDLA